MIVHGSPILVSSLFDAVMQTALDAIVICRAIRDESNVIIDFRVVRCNEQAAAMTGFSVEQMMQETMLTLDPEGLKSGIFETYRQVTETGLPTHIVHHFGDADVWMTQSLARYDDGVVGSWADISPLKRAEQERQQQTDLLQSVLDSSSNAIIAFTAVRNQTTQQIIDFQYVAHNEANRRNMNGTDETILGKTLLAFFPQMVDMGLFGQFVSVVESGEAIRFEQEFTDDGWAGWYEISALKWSDGMVLTLVNITASKTHQQELELANRNLTYAYENLQQFAKVASHDLQEPLRKIISFGDLLQGQFAPELGDSGKDMVSRIQLAAHRMSDLIRDVLAYSRVSTPRKSPGPVALASIVSDVQFEFQNSFDLVDLRLDVDELPTVRCDRAQMKQLLSHLFANALKFRASDRPASLHISCRTMAGTVYPNLLNPVVTYYEISFTDNGIGFDNRYASQLFQVFQRLHTRQKYPGTGVGLAICKRIMENHQGAITATATPGEGAIFQVYLPQQ